MKSKGIFQGKRSYIYVMNVIFAVIFIAAAAILLFLEPENFLSALLSGAGKSATLCISLIATYAVWMGLMKVWEDSGISRGVSRLLKPVAKKLFKTEHEETLDAVCMNLSVNLLGISGAATPYGVRAANLLDKTEHAEYASAMFFILNATSIQLIPTSIISVRMALGSAAPADIALPTLIATVFSTLLGAVLCRIFIPPKKAENTAFFLKTKGAGI